MSKKKHIRVRQLTYDRLIQAARELELSIGELADRWLSECLDARDEAREEDQYGNGEDNESEYCSDCDRSVDPDHEYCPWCGECLEPD